jgi:hypothetical protein
MPRFFFSDTAALKQQLTRYLSAQRAHHFHGNRPQSGFRFADELSLAHPDIEDFEKGTTIKSLHLHTLHAALSAQRTAWATLQTMTMALESDFRQEFGDEAMTFFTMLAADPPGGSIDNVTHEHVANLIALLKSRPLPSAIGPGTDTD